MEGNQISKVFKFVYKMHKNEIFFKHFAMLSFCFQKTDNPRTNTLCKHYIKFNIISTQAA